jgi:hypothetical protein
MFDEEFYQIHRGEIFQKSKCMAREHEILGFFQTMLAHYGYASNSKFNRVHVKGSKKVIVCFADDFNVCRTDFSKSPEQWFDTETTVITDNHIMFTPVYKVYQLPVSYFGIFSYQPQNQNYNPVRRFNFSANRIDANRLLTLLELFDTCGGVDYVLENDFVNFNAWDFVADNNTSEQLKTNFLTYWEQIKKSNLHLHGLIDNIKNRLPIRNHQWTIEEICVSANINLVIETYSGNSTHAFSEKIFRALVTPAPWMLYSAKDAVKYLSILGFDTLDDLIDHSYNEVYDRGNHDSTKIKSFMNFALKNYENLNKYSTDAIRQRCMNAAQHNQQLLARLKTQWHNDFAQYLSKIVPEIC